MFIVRSVQLSDIDDLHDLSQLVTLINLPSDKYELEKKVINSVKSFKSPSKKLENNYYIFILMNTATNKIVGASMIHGKHGTPKEPHFYLKVGREHKLSTSLNTGFIHGTLKFGMETDGYTEIGGLILAPEYRGHPEKLGKLLSFARFHYIGQNSEHFTDYIHSELLPPFDKNGNSPLWEAIGRPFLNLDYHDADKLSRDNKEFITSLYPIDTIYEALLPIEARNAIGKVGKETEPVKKMLESIGFRYIEEVDPFDGGPHFRAPRVDIKPIKEQRVLTLVITENDIEEEKHLVSITHGDHSFYSLQLCGIIEGDNLIVNKKNTNLEPGQKVIAFPL
jgi:arginine N-succinyltransferase